jgi:hypothetical protein
VDIILTDFVGEHVKCASLPQGDSSTYSDNPWLFSDSEIHDKLVIKSEEVFRSEPWYVQYKAGATRAYKMRPLHRMS